MTRKFAFVYTPSSGWLGGKNYYVAAIRNLHGSIIARKLKDDIYVFSDPDSDLSDIASLDRVKIIKTRLLSRRRFYFLLIKAVNKILGENLTLVWALRSNKIDLLCHSYIPKWTGIKSLPWIPDFQHCHMPSNFSKVELFNRNWTFSKYLSGENVLFSSASALNDAKKFYRVRANTWVYRFHPLPAEDYNEAEFTRLLDRKMVLEKFVFLPNQFWLHKNHRVVFEAAKLALDEGRPFNLVCTGKLSDFRDPKYPNEMLEYVSENRLGQYVKYLGLVDRDVFNCLLREAEVVINPSFFEGWSTTVEEAKVLGKKMVLSNIDVHLEQVGRSSGVVYFDPSCAKDCLNAINKSLLDENRKYDYEIQSDSIYDVLERLVPKGRVKTL